jgi:hypothetical protein
MIKNIIKSWIVIIIASVFFADPGFGSTPQITGVTGTIQNGTVITINGQYLMDLNTTTWSDTAAHASFESASSLSAAYSYNVDNWSWFAGGTGTIAYDSNAIHGNHSVKIVNSSNCPEDSQSCGHITLYKDLTSSSEYYMAGYVRYDWSHHPSQYLKFLLSNGPTQWYFQPMANGNDPTTNWAYEQGSSLIGHPTVQSGSLQWHHWEVHWKRSPTPIYEIWWDGVQKLSTSTNVDSGGSFTAQEWGTPNLSGQTSTSTTLWMDAQVISTSRIYPWTKVEIGNSATYASATKVTQVLTTISDTSIAITADLTGLGNGPYYLFVTNNKQERNSAYSLSGGTTPPPSGGGSDTTAPITTITTSNPSSISSDSLPISGTANDDTAVSGCKWLIGSAPDATHGTALTGTASWNGTASGFSSGSNSLYVGCYDAAGNYGSNSITVNYTPTQTVFFTEGFEDSSWSSRGWYDNTSHGKIATSSCHTGNCLQWTWAQGGTAPTNGNTVRKVFTATDSLYVSYWIKFATGWRGSQQAYHPHMITIPSNLDYAADPYGPLANNYLNTYLEFISDIGSPYAIRSVLGLQDELRVNTSKGIPPNNLSSVTESRSVNFCNTPVSTDATGICYADSTYYSANVWTASSVSISTNTWHHVEVYMHMNSISGNVGQHDGVMKEWIDDTLVIDHSDILYRTNQDATKKWQEFALSPWIGDGAPIAETMYLDDLVVANSRGTSEESPPPSATLPGAPGSLRVE